MQNWIPDLNRFSIPKPPEWFLKMLWDFDAALVMLPSRQANKYLLARRRSLSKPMSMIEQRRKQFSEKTHTRTPLLDGDLLESHQLVGVDSIRSVTGNLFDASWMASAPGIMQSLRERDMWAAGGAEAYNKRLIAAEQAERDKQQATISSDMEHRTNDAWRSHQARTGQRNQRASSVPVRSIVPATQVTL